VLFLLTPYASLLTDSGYILAIFVFTGESLRPSSILPQGTEDAFKHGQPVDPEKTRGLHPQLAAGK
jgi:hypothetical protein